MPAYTYRTPAPGADAPREARELFRRLADQLLDQGGVPLRPLARNEKPTGPLRFLIDQGYLELEPRPDGPGLRLAPRGLRECEELALLEMFGPTGADGLGRHEAGRAGTGPVPGDDPRPHTPGDPLDHLDLSATLSNALHRQLQERAPGLPVRLHPDDLVVRQPEASGRWSVALLLDMSGSMARGGLFAAARRTALAFRALMRRRFPGDELFVAGFATRVVPLTGADLVEAVPRPVGLVDRTSDLRLPGGLAFEAGAGKVPEHFTNLQAALRLARRWLRGRAGNRLAVVITDGEPTAYLDGGELVLSYPTTPDAVRHTLDEARRCAGEGVRLSVFALPSDTTSPALHTFGTRLARAGRGTAVLCPAGQVGRRESIRQFVNLRNQAR